jgi:hypothetical protein
MRGDPADQDAQHLRLLSIFHYLAGRFLARRRHHTFCMVIAAVACTFMPLGTVLGVFSLIVLSRESVRESFAPGPPPLPVVGA